MGNIPNDVVQDDDYTLYIIVSQTGTVLSRLLKAVTGASYNHVSISLDKTLTTMYSFGRISPYNPVWGGFVMESPQTGTFKRFAKTEAVVLGLYVSEEQYKSVFRVLEAMYRCKQSYHYNYLGLFLAAFHIRYRRKGRYYCSEFVRDFLISSQIVDAGQFARITQPFEFMHLKTHIPYIVVNCNPMTGGFIQRKQTERMEAIMEHIGIGIDEALAS